MWTRDRWVITRYLLTYMILFLVYLWPFPLVCESKMSIFVQPWMVFFSVVADFLIKNSGIQFIFCINSLGRKRISLWTWKSTKFKSIFSTSIWYIIIIICVQHMCVYNAYYVMHICYYRGLRNIVVVFVVVASLIINVIINMIPFFFYDCF